MGVSPISNHGYLIGAILFLLVQSQFWTFSHGLQCFSCWKFHCDEPSDSCKEMKRLPFANNQTREVSENWRESPECPSDSDILYLSKRYVQNCSEHQTACGSYFIKVTAAIAKNSLDKIEYPILVTPNYYYSTIVALGCVTPEENTENEVNVTVRTTLSTTTKMNATVTTAISTTTTTSPSKLNVSTTEVTKMVDETVTKPNINSTTTSSETTSNDNTKISTSTEKSNGEEKRSSTTKLLTSSSAAPLHSDSKTKSDHNPLEDVAPPLPLRKARHHEDGGHKSHEDDSPSEHNYNEYEVVPFESSNSNARRCPMEFAHVENRTSYGTLERINMSAVFTVCSQCNRSLCNSAYPHDDSLVTVSSSSSSSPPPQSTTPYNSTSSSFHPKSTFCGVSLASTVVVGLFALTHVLHFVS